MPVTRLTSAFTLGIGALLGIACWGIAAREWAVLERERVRELEDVGREVRAVATALTPEVGRARAAGLASEGLEAIFEGGWRWISLDPAALDRSDPTLRRMAKRDVDALLGGKSVSVELGEDDETRIAVLTPVPALTDGGTHRVLEVTFGMADMRATHDDTIRDLGISLALAMLAIAVATAVLGHLLITRPLRSATALVRRVIDGQLDGRLPADTTGEMGELHAAVNTLCDRLAASVASIEEHRRANQDVEASLRRADQLASIGKLAAGIAHELNTPLNVALARANAIARNAEDVSESRRKAEIIAEQVERMTGIVRQLLDFSRPHRPNKAEVNAHEEVARCVELIEPQARKAEVTFTVEDPAAPPMLRADPAQLQQVFLNLLINAIHASPGGGEVTVRLARERARPPEGDGTDLVDAIRIDVIDNGVGIRDEDLERIFDPFFTTKQPGEGTGLGLAVSWSIVHEHGGWMAVESRESQGTRFSVHLPIEAVTEAAPA